MCIRVCVSTYVLHKCEARAVWFAKQDAEVKRKSEIFYIHKKRADKHPTLIAF